jgi:hypothetical protein
VSELVACGRRIGGVGKRSATDNTDNIHYELVVLRHGAEMFVINTDPGNTFTVDFKRQ